MFPALERYLADADPSRLYQGLPEEVERLYPELLRLDIMQAVVVSVVDFFSLDKAEDVNGVSAFYRHFLEVGVLEDNVFVFGHLVTADRFLYGEIFVVLLAVQHLSGPRQAFFVEQMEADRPGLGAHVHFDRYGHQPEADDTFPESPGHSHLLRN